MVDPEWARNIVLLPPNPFRGPVGAFQRTQYELTLSLYKYMSLCQLRVEAVERHYFGGEHCAFKCPRPSCTAYFDQPGQWPAHVDATGHFSDAEVPPEFAAEYAAHEARIEARLEQGRDIARDTMRNHWGMPDTAQRRAAERAFLEQIEHVPLYACSKPAEQTIMWKHYKMVMSREEQYQ